MTRGHDSLGSDDFLPSVSDLDVLWLDESILAVVGDDGRARPWIDPLLSPAEDDEEDGDLYDDDEDDLDDLDDFDDDDEDLFDDDDLDDDDDEDEDEDEEEDGY